MQLVWPDKTPLFHAFIQAQKQYLFVLNRIIERYKKISIHLHYEWMFTVLPHIIFLYYTAQPKFTVNIHYKP